MIPVLYDATETTFTHNGIGWLYDATECNVSEERNGAFELSLTYPMNGALFDEIAEGCIIKAKPNETSDPQLFRIYKSTKPIGGLVTFSAEHISYELNGIPIAELIVNGVTPQSAMTTAFDNAALEHPFTAWSDIETQNHTSVTVPRSLRALLGGQSGSILDVWGGEYEFDNYVVKLHQHRGTDTDIVIEYGKNLTDITQERNIAECYTHIFPFATTKDTGATVTLTEQVLALTNAENIGRNRCYMLDMTSSFSEDETITETLLRQKATDYIDNSSLGTPKVNIKASFVQLWQTVEYENIAPLERVKLCDTVTVRFSKLGISVRAKVIKTVYDVLAERYTSVELGDSKSSLADTIDDIYSTCGEAATTADVTNATSWIAGNNGGHAFIMRDSSTGKPKEFVVLDTESISTAVQVWRWNLGGLGHSSSGYNGTFTLAMTQDGKFVADFIQTGQLADVNGRFVIDLDAGTIDIYDEDGNTLLSYSPDSGLSIEGGATFSGDLSAAGGTFAGDLSAAGGTFAGDLSAAGGTFSGDLSAAGGTFSGDLSAAGGTFAGELSAATGSFAGEVTATTGTIGGWVIGETKLSSLEGEGVELDAGNGLFVLGDVVFNRSKYDGRGQIQPHIDCDGDLIIGATEGNNVVVWTGSRPGAHTFTFDGSGNFSSFSASFTTPLELNSGGTGANNVADAQVNLGIQHGVEDVVFSDSNYETCSVSFPNDFVSAPDVVLTPRHNSQADVTIKLLTTPTISGFTFAVTLGAAASITIPVTWIAVQ